MNKDKNIFDIKLDKNSQSPLYIQLSERITELIEIGQLIADEKLPPIRLFAKKLGVNNTTIINAYKNLENKKLVYTKVGSGTYVSALDINAVPEPIVKQQKSITKINKDILPEAINFAKSSVSPDLFPVNEFKKLFNDVLERDKGNAFSFQDIQGFLPLRQSIAKNLEKYGIRTSAERIQVISGAQQGIDIISKVMLSAGDTVFVEKPTYYGAVGAILSRGARIIEVPINDDGIDIEKLEALLKLYSPKFIYVMPIFQTPTCVSYSMEKKRKLLEIAYKQNIYIVEEDNLSNFNYSDIQIKSLKSLDYKNKVIYIKSFSKILMPGLRLGFMVLPKSILENVMSAKYNTDISTSSFIQRAFDMFIRNGDCDRHIKRMKNIFGEKYEFMQEIIKKRLSNYFSYIEPNGGLSFYLKIKSKNVSAEMVCKKLAERNVIVTPSDIYNLSDDNTEECLRISFANISNAKAEKGIDIIAEVMKDIISKN